MTPDHTEQALTRSTILNRLKNAPPSKRVAQRKRKLPSLPFISMTQQELTDAFVRHATEQSVQVHRVKGNDGLLAALESVIRQESLSRLVVSGDDFVENLNLKEWGGKKNITVMTASDLNEMDSYKDELFRVEASFTVADFAVAESGTLVIRHNERNARLLSLAPPHHLAVVPIDRLVPVYETAVHQVIQYGGLPSQLTFITGPSMTADIQATPFRGMHGPERLTVFLHES